MAENILKIPHILPLTMRRINPAVLPQYISKHIDLFRYSDTIEEWQQQTHYLQRWQNNDVIRQQYRTEIGPLYLNVYNCYGVRIDVIEFTQKQKDRFNPKSFIYEISAPMAQYKPGNYFFTLGIGGTNLELYVSEPCNIAEVQDKTVLIEYSHDEYREGVFWETGIRMSLRVQASLKFAPGSNTTGFEDQRQNITIIDDVPYRVWTLRIGRTTGVPDNFADKINRILGSNRLFIDGIQYSKSEESKLEARESKGYPMRWWSIELREAFNEDSLTYVDNIPNLARAAVVLNVDSKGFAPDNTGNSIRQIKVIE